MSRELEERGDHCEMEAALRRLGLLEPHESARWTPLLGGVSSELWRVDLPNRSLCLKRARAVLAVEAEWHAPVERSGYEVAWLEAAREIEPEAVPRVLGQLPEEHLFVMEYLAPSQYRVWKSELSAGRVDIPFAAEVGRLLGRLHAGFAGDAAMADRFATDDLFHSLRIAPYLLATAEAHLDLSDQIESLAERTAKTRLTLIHGDVSPKNILMGPKGPVLLDAECAWYGDPAFDVAFFGTHLLLKCHWVPAQRSEFLKCFEIFKSAHGRFVSWEAHADFDSRVATLLPALLLARVDGKSPVEYLGAEKRDRVRRVARRMLLAPAQDLEGVLELWQRSFAS